MILDFCPKLTITDTVLSFPFVDELLQMASVDPRGSSLFLQYITFLVDDLRHFRTALFCSTVHQPCSSQNLTYSHAAPSCGIFTPVICLDFLPKDQARGSTKHY